MDPQTEADLIYVEWRVACARSAALHEILRKRLETRGAYIEADWMERIEKAAEEAEARLRDLKRIPALQA